MNFHCSLPTIHSPLSTINSLPPRCPLSQNDTKSCANRPGAQAAQRYILENFGCLSIGGVALKWIRRRGSIHQMIIFATSRPAHFADVCADPPARDKCRGFTLVELLVVIGIISLLVAVLMPALSKARRAARATACLSNLRQVGQTLMMYANDNKGAMPGVVWSGASGVTPYANRLGFGGGRLAGAIPGFGFANVGLLCFTGYANWGPMFFCPGREDTDPMSWNQQYKPSQINFNAGWNWNPGWNAGSFGWIDGAAGYLIATSDRSQDHTVDMGKSHVLGKCAPDTILAMDVFCWGEGATQEGHGNGYNIASFDGSAWFYPDPGTSSGNPNYPAEQLFQGTNYPGAIPMPGAPHQVGPDVAGPIGVQFSGASRWSPWYGVATDPRAWPSGIPYIEKNLMGWTQQKIQDNTPQ